MGDPFLNLAPTLRRGYGGARNAEVAVSHSFPEKGGTDHHGGSHDTRKHAKLAASGSERWVNCTGSVALSEGLPDRSTPAADEGTRAHEVLDDLFQAALRHQWVNVPVIALNVYEFRTKVPREMLDHAKRTADFILGVHRKHPGSDLLVETKVKLDFIHPDMWGTFDSAVVDHFGTLHVFDYKYGKGHAVSPRENLQMIFYGLGLAYRYQWNFKRVRLWIIQPRIRGYDGPAFWEISTKELVRYADLFRDAVLRIEKKPTYKEGPWCFFCKAKGICPLKSEAKLDKARMVFTNALLPAKL